MVKIINSLFSIILYHLLIIINSHQKVTNNINYNTIIIKINYERVITTINAIINL